MTEHTMYKKSFQLNSPTDTDTLANAIGKQLRGGNCIELVSDLGGGKTTFTRGLVRGIGSLDSVSSPTFTIGKQYKSDTLTCYHYDFYRLQDPGLVAEELAEALEDTKAVIIVEWAESVAHVLPENRMIIHLDKVAESSDARICRIEYGEQYQEIIEGLQL